MKAVYTPLGTAGSVKNAQGLQVIINKVESIIVSNLRNTDSVIFEVQKKKMDLGHL